MTMTPVRPVGSDEFAYGLSGARPLTAARLAGRSGHLLVAAVRNPAVTLSVIFLVAIVAAAVFAPEVAPHSPFKANPRLRLHGPSSGHPFGTDAIGRDVLSRLIYGARVSLRIGVFAVLLGETAAILLGLTSGFWQGPFDMVLQRLFDALQAFPGLIFAMLVVTMFGRGESKILVPLAILSVPGTTRIVRSSVFAVKQADYIKAAQVLGAGTWRIMLRHVLPNVMGPIIVLTSLSIGFVILAEAGLSFLGLGVQPPQPSWGLMLATDGRTQMEAHAYLVVFPALAISLTILSLNLIGDALRDAFDPRLRGRR
jgi:peptide/nickel transport system permease protein